MQILVGLGNPGNKYANNRHNIGFMALDGLAAAHGFTPWRRKFQAQISEGRLSNEKILLLKPQTFMNLSGQSVGEAAHFYKATAQDVTVFHDELDLAPGQLKVKQGGGHAGHNGLRSLHAHIGDAYQRVRLGIGHPGRKDLVANYVLHDFAETDALWLGDLLRGLCDGVADLAAGDAGRFMNIVAQRKTPPPSSTGQKTAAKARLELGDENTKPPRKKGAQSHHPTGKNLSNKHTAQAVPAADENTGAKTGQNTLKALKELMDKLR